jgi:hypothetical protein
MIHANLDGTTDLDLARLITSNAVITLHYRGRDWRLVSVGPDTIVTGVEVTKLEDVDVKGDRL